jgi:hypothetical protein
MACVLATPAAAEEKMDLQQLYKAALSEGMKNPSKFLRSLKGNIPLGESRPIDPKQYGGNVALMMVPVQAFHPYTTGFTSDAASDGIY